MPALAPVWMTVINWWLFPSRIRLRTAAVATPWILVLHADTHPGPGWQDAARAFMADPANARRAAYFRFALDDASPQARRLERLVAWRCRQMLRT